MSAATAPSFQWSDLARKSIDVGEALDAHGEVTVVRGAVSLRLAPEAPADVKDVLTSMCRLLVALVAHDEPTQVSRVLESAWPWTRALPAADQVALAAEVGPIAEMCESLGDWSPLIDVIADWRRTARAWASGATPVARVADPLGTEVERPSA